jgi:hypothetical protein
VRISDRLAIRVFHRENRAAFAFYRFGDYINRVRFGEISSSLRLRMRRPVSLYEQTRAERCDCLRVVAGAAANRIRVYFDEPRLSGKSDRGQEYTGGLEAWRRKLASPKGALLLDLLTGAGSPIR